MIVARRIVPRYGREDEDVNSKTETATLTFVCQTSLPHPHAASLRAIRRRFFAFPAHDMLGPLGKGFSHQGRLVADLVPR